MIDIEFQIDFNLINFNSNSVYLDLFYCLQNYISFFTYIIQVLIEHVNFHYLIILVVYHFLLSLLYLMLNEKSHNFILCPLFHFLNYLTSIFELQNFIFFIQKIFKLILSY